MHVANRGLGYIVHNRAWFFITHTYEWHYGKKWNLQLKLTYTYLFSKKQINLFFRSTCWRQRIRSFIAGSESGKSTIISNIWDILQKNMMAFETLCTNLHPCANVIHLVGKKIQFSCITNLLPPHGRALSIKRQCRASVKIYQYAQCINHENFAQEKRLHLWV